MMKIVNKYIADDGREFLNAKDCEEHERNYYAAKAIMSALPEKPSSCDFSNGGGYIQHDRDTLTKARADFCEFAKRYTDLKWLQETIDGGLEIHAGWAGRAIADAAPQSIYNLWARFDCIDDSLREWGQPYYASHPDKGDQNRIG